MFPGVTWRVTVCFVICDSVSAGPGRRGREHHRLSAHCFLLHWFLHSQQSPSEWKFLLDAFRKPYVLTQQSHIQTRIQLRTISSYSSYIYIYVLYIHDNSTMVEGEDLMFNLYPHFNLILYLMSPSFSGLKLDPGKPGPDQKSNRSRDPRLSSEWPLAHQI